MVQAEGLHQEAVRHVGALSCKIRSSRGVKRSGGRSEPGREGAGGLPIVSGISGANDRSSGWGRGRWLQVHRLNSRCCGSARATHGHHGVLVWSNPSVGTSVICLFVYLFVVFWSQCMTCCFTSHCKDMLFLSPHKYALISSLCLPKACGQPTQKQR